MVNQCSVLAPLLFFIYLLVGSGAKEEQQGLNLSGTLCRPSIRPITIFHRFSFIHIIHRFSFIHIGSKYRIQQAFRPAANTWPVDLYLAFVPQILLCFFLYQTPFFEGFGNKCMLQYGDLEFLLPGYILDMSVTRHVQWSCCVSVSCSDQ